VRTEGGDWNDAGSRTEGTPVIRVAIALLVGLLVMFMLMRPLADRLVLGEGSSTGLRLELFPGSPGITLGEKSLYAENDPWSAWLADEDTCPRGEDATAPAEVQVQVLLCLVNFARDYHGVQPVELSPLLSATAAAKARDIVLCRDFRHEACGKHPFQVADDRGYRGSIGENLYVAEGQLEAPRLALDTWLNSEGHRKNLLQPEWGVVGIALLPGANLDDIEDGVVWVNHFGP
jgi:hypothetical protein